MNKTELFHTTNIKAATALLTLGFKKLTISRIVRDDGRESMVFWFEPTNAEGERAQDVYHGMTKGGEALAKAEPDNDINYLRAYAANRDEVIAEIHATPRFVAIENNGRRVSVSEHASAETRRKIADML